MMKTSISIFGSVAYRAGYKECGIHIRGGSMAFGEMMAKDDRQVEHRECSIFVMKLAESDDRKHNWCK